MALYGLIEELVRSAPPQWDAGGAPGSGVATARDALTAVAQLARAIEAPAQAGDLDPEQAHRMASLLLAVRDFVAPLGPEVDAHVSGYLGQVVRELRG